MPPKRVKLRLTPDVQDRIVQALRAGNYVDTAAQFAGISRPTLYRWLERGDRAAEKADLGETLSEQEEMFLNFRNEVDAARASATVRNVSLISQAAQNSWQAAAWWLERTNPNLWGRQTRTEVSGPNNGPINVSVTADDLEIIVRTILQSDDEDEVDSDDNS